METAADRHREQILSAGDEYLRWMGQFPVISLTLKSMKQPTWELAFEMLKKPWEQSMTAIGKRLRSAAA